MAMSGPPCATCGTMLRWFPDQNAWGCDRCQKMFPVGPPQPQAAPPMQQPPMQQQPMQQPPMQQYGAPPMQQYGAPPMQPQYGGPQGMPAGAVAPAAARGKSKALFIALGGAVVAVAVVLVIVLKGGKGGVGSRDELVKQTLAAISSGDAVALEKLGSMATLKDMLLDCDKPAGYGGSKHKHDDDDVDPAEIHKQFEKLVAKTKDLKIELVEVTDDDKKEVMKKGEKAMDTCHFKADFTSTRLKIKVKVTAPAKDGKPAKEGKDQKVRLEVLELDGRWYLLEPPKIKPPSGGAGEAMAKMEELRDQMCKCKDKACADKADADFDKAMTEMAKGAGPDEMPDEADMKRMTDIMKQHAECKVAARKASAQPPTPTPQPPADPAGTLPPIATDGMPAECDEYKALIAKLVACDKLPQASRDAMKQAAAAIDQSWSAVHGGITPELKKIMADSCKQGADAMKQTVSAMGC